MLKGAAKTAYMRDYMRRRRAGEPQPKKPRKPREPSRRPPKIEKPVRELRCIFCGKPEREVGHLVGDGHAQICGQCIEEAAEVLRNAQVMQEPQPQEEPLSPREEAIVADVMRQHPSLTYERAVYWLRAAGM
jgi:hypothetical protein